MTQASWIDDLPATAPVEVVPRTIPKTTSLERLGEIQSSLLAENLAILADAVHFCDIDKPVFDPETGRDAEQEVPQSWRDEGLSDEQIKKRMRVAQATWLCAKEAPVGLAISKSLVVGVVKAMSAQQTGPKTLNVAFVNITSPLPAFRERDMTKELEKK